MNAGRETAEHAPDGTVADLDSHHGPRGPADAVRIERLESEIRRRDQALVSSAARMAAQDRRIHALERELERMRTSARDPREALFAAEREATTSRCAQPADVGAPRASQLEDDDENTASDGPWSDDDEPTPAPETQESADADIRFPQAKGLRPQGPPEQSALGARWPAIDTTNRRAVGVLVFARPLNDAGTRRLQKLRLARHENLARVLAVGTTPTGPYVVFESAVGESLEEWVDRVGPLSDESALSVAVQIARGLREAAFHGAVHGDLSPRVVHVDKAGRARVRDVGIGALHPTTDRPVLAPEYASPERLRGSPPPDVRCDAYSLGAVLHFLLVGRPPYEGDRAQVVRGHALQGPPDPRSTRAEVSPECAKLVLRLMSRDPDSRPATWDQALVELDVRLPRARVDDADAGLRGRLARLVKLASRR